MRVRVVAGLALALGACTGTIGGSSSAGPDGENARGGKGARAHDLEGDPAQASDPAVGGKAGGGASEDGTRAGDDPAAGGADSDTPGPGAAPLRRLSSREYMNTVGDLFPGIAIPAQSFPPPVHVAGFENNELSLPPTSLLAESEMSAASAIAAVVVTARDKWVQCASGENLECARQTALALLPRAYRRPPSDEERTRVLAFMDASVAASDFVTALQDLVQVVLVSPQFLYRIELGQGGGSAGTWVDLDPYELASRLSYFLWQTMPDAELFAAADDGSLSDAAVLRAQAERMLADARARDVVADFHRQWLELDRLNTLKLDATAFPELDEPLRQALRASIEQYTQWAFWDERSVGSLFGADRVYANAELAPLLGVGAQQSELTATSAPNRRGLLTQPGLLASTSHGNLHSPILRGVQILRKFLCVNIPPPPPGVVAALEPIPAGAARTTREHFSQTHRKTECASCHDLIDNAGFALEGYDALGRYVTEENGVAIDSSGSLPFGAAGTTEVHGGVELSTALAGSDEVQNCLANQWYRFAFGRAPSEDSDLAEVAALGASLRASGGDPQALLLAIVGSASFRTRPAVAPQ